MMLDKNYWQNRYLNRQTAWDAGQITPPIQTFFDQLEARDCRILIPGCGNAHEAAYLHNKGFHQVFLCDWASKPLANFAQQYPGFPEDHLICANFFELNEQPFDYIIEQTFFCAIAPNKRSYYAEKTAELLIERGQLVGLLFDKVFEQEGPPFGGTKKEYHTYFDSIYSDVRIEPCYNSIGPRQGAEFFILATK